MAATGVTGQNGPSGSPLQVNQFDALGRKVARYDNGSASPSFVFYYDGHRVLEEYSVSGAQQQEAAIPSLQARPTLASQLMSPQIARRYYYGIDYFYEIVAVDPDGFNPHFSVLQDINWNVVGVADSTRIVEQKRYEPYGEFEGLETVTYDTANPPNPNGAPSFLTNPAQSKLPHSFAGMESGLRN